MSSYVMGPWFYCKTFSRKESNIRWKNAFLKVEKKKKTGVILVLLFNKAVWLLKTRSTAVHY